MVSSLSFCLDWIRRKAIMALSWNPCRHGLLFCRTSRIAPGRFSIFYPLVNLLIRIPSWDSGVPSGITRVLLPRFTSSTLGALPMWWLMSGSKRCIKIIFFYWDGLINSCFFCILKLLQWESSAGMRRGSSARSFRRSGSFWGISISSRNARIPCSVAARSIAHFSQVVYGREITRIRAWAFLSHLMSALRITHRNPFVLGNLLAFVWMIALIC